MRDLRDFSGREWRRAMPLVHALKQVRNDAVQRVYLSQRPAGLERFLSSIGAIHGGNLVQVVAFEQPRVVEWLLTLFSRNVIGASIVVFDNSRNRDARRRIERVCHEHAVPYLALPWNPTRHVNRHHGMALTWIFRNIVRVLQPRMFGFIDHDLIPVKDIDVGALLDGQPFYGLLEVSKQHWGWSLWAGYCFYNFEAVHDLPLNFLYDFSRGLDTGARNWNCLYSHCSKDALRFGTSQFIDIPDRSKGVPLQLQVIDGRWIHLRGVGYNDNWSRMESTHLRLERALNAGADLEDLRESGLP